MSKYYCPDCKYTTSKISNFKAHLTTNKHLLNSGKLFDKNLKKEKPSLTFECDYCQETFNSIKRKEKHIEKNHKNTNSSSTHIQKPEGIFTVDDVKEIIKSIFEVQRNVSNLNSTNNSNSYNTNNSNNSNNINQNIQHNVNIQFLNSNFGNIPSIQSFQKELQEDLKLTISEANIIYDCFSNAGLYAYGRHLAQLLRYKYQQQIEANQIDILDETYPFPLYANDSNHRHHHEKFEHSWEKSMSDDNIIKLVNEINTQVHRLRGFIIPISAKGVKKVVKIIKTINGTRTAFIPGGLLQDTQERPPITEELIMSWHPSVRDSYLEAFRRNIRLPVTIDDE